MKSSHNRTSRHAREDGQVLMLFGLFSIVLILFVGLGIDLGFAYITKAQLSKAMDAATLAAVSNYSGADGGKAANLIAENTFWANYATNGISGRATGFAKLTPVGTFSTDANGNLIYSNTVSAQINTFLLRLLPQWRTLTVGDTAVATRAPVVMTLALDRTGSMTPRIATGPCLTGTGGGAYLPGAVTEFINIFDETLDRAALVTFSVSAVTDVPMSAKGKPFKNNIINGANNLRWGGATCSVAGLTNALLIQNSSGAPANAVKVVVFFTDGRANMTTSIINGVPLNFGGSDPDQPGCPPPPTTCDFYLTNAPEFNPGPVCTIQNNNCNGSMPGCTISGKTFNNPTFTDASGNQQHFCPLYITTDATNRCLLVANQMRASSNYVYAVGLSAGAFAAPTLVTLQQIANDPNSPTFDKTQPVGAAFISNGNDLSEVFQQVAADIILRLVH